MELTVSLLEGVYLDGSKHSKTHVYSTGRGTNSDPVRVRSATVTIQEFWIQTRDGAEEKITLQNAEVNARQGHDVAMVIVGDDEGNSSYVGYLNFNTNLKQKFDNSNTARQFAQSAAPYVLTMAIAFIAFGVGWYLEGFIVGLISLAAGMLASVLVRNIHAMGIESNINKKFEEASVFAYEQHTQKRLVTPVQSQITTSSQAL